MNLFEEASTEWDIKRPLIKSANTQKIVMAIEVKRFSDKIILLKFVQCTKIRNGIMEIK